MSITMALKGWN